ncbi:MAG: pectinesterase family protein, partial [Bacteroidales bacterium]|nr:pectinesterase family protein [Bacteroidales bacterium]
SYFYNVTFTGYHDTLEAENGRQYYDHCYIEGRTDYIFGNTATCYFYCCNIHTIGAGDNNNGGYVMAIKGTGVDYGYIFNYCAFTTDLETYYTGVEVDEDFKYTVEGTVSVARTWSGSDMHIAILNSSFDAGFSKEAYIASTGKGESGKNSRYTHMTAGQAPTPEYLVEYGNSGDGAISASIENTCTVYTNETDVADYLDFTKIFAAQNGSVKYDDDWSGASIEIVTVTVTADGGMYIVTGYKNSLTVGDVIAAVKSENATVEITTLYDETGNALDETMKIGADMTLTAETAEADMTVPSSVTYDFSGADTSIPQSVETGWLGYLYVDTGTNGEFKQNDAWYILTNDATITVRLSAGSSITFEMYTDPSLAINGVTISSNEMEVSDGRYYYTYTVTSGVTEDVVISRSTSGSLYFKTITITVPVIYQIGDYIDFTDATGITYQGSVDEYKGVQIDTTASGAKFAYDGAGCIQINTGTILCIPSVPGAWAEVNFWGSYSGRCNVSTDEDGIITITFTELSDNKTYIIGITITEDTDYEGPNAGTNEPVEITGVTLDNSVITIGIGEEVVLSAIVEFSDGTSAGGYTDVAYSWAFSVTGVVSQSGSGNNITLKGLNEGTVTVTVSVNGFTAQCVINVFGTYSEDLTSETYTYVFGNMGIDSIPTPSDSKTDSGKTYYFSETSWSESVIGNGVLSYTTHSDKINTSDSIMVNGVTYTGSIQPNGATQSSGNRSFRIDLSSYLGNSSSITIEVICAASAVKNEEASTYSTSQILISKSNTTTDPNEALSYTPVEDTTSGTYTARDLIYSVNMDDFVSGATDYYITFTQTSRVYAVILTVDGVSESRKIDYDGQIEVIFKTNSETIEDITSYVFSYSAVSAPVLPNVSGKYFIGWYTDENLTVAYDFSLPVTEDLTLYAKWDTFDSEITYIQGAYESIAIEFKESNLDGVKIYYKEEGASSYTTFTDVGAMRTIDNDDYLVRVDIVGLTGNKYYNVKVTTSANEELTDGGAAYSLYVASYDRSGYAHFNYDVGVGAYEDDGTLKDGTLVIYVTEDNKNDVTDYVYKYDKKSDSYSKVEWTELSQYLLLTGDDLESYKRFDDDYVRGIGEILNNSRYSSTGRKNVGIAALCDAYGAVDVRIVGEVKATINITSSYEGEDKETGGAMTLYTGYYDIVGLTDLNAATNGGSEGDNGGLVRVRNAHDVTIEGVGEGATLNGWGISIVADSSATNKIAEGFEVRNLTFKNTPEDAVGIEGNQSGNELTATVERCWIHNNSFYIGHCDYPAESDKGDGDGTIDFKRGQYLTISYNYFEGCHKTILLGSNASSLQYNISMHHNYWYECQQRMPLVRNANVHFYNNYINGNSDSNLLYVTSVRANSYVYAEYNYYENCRSVCLVVEESGAGGVMKSYMNEYHNCYGSDYTAEDNDVDESVHVSSRTEYVENNCKDEANGIDYSRFDTDPTLFYYDATKGWSDCYLTSAAQAKNDVIRMAGAF